jgi:DnaK suppressor protein
MDLDTNFINEIKKSLEVEKNKLEATLSSLKTQDPYRDPDRLNDNASSDTDAAEESNHERVEALEKELRKHLDEVNQALTRMSVNKYGLCMNCSKAIGAKRLKIKPTALYCMDCELKLEK